MSDGLPTSWLSWPSANKTSANYKYVSVEFSLSMDQKNWSISTYRLLDWLSEVGGLFNTLLYVTKVLVGPMAGYTLRSTLVSNLFRYKKSRSVSKSKTYKYENNRLHS